MKPAILVVDDMAIYREPIEALLRSEGYRTRSAADGHEAMTIMQTDTPDLVLLDLTMPVMDGMRVLWLMRRHPKLTRVPVIILSAGADRRKVTEAASLGIGGYILKSQFSSQSVLSRVAKQLSLAAAAVPTPDSPDSTSSSSSQPSATSTRHVRPIPPSHVVDPNSEVPQDQTAALRSLQPITTGQSVLERIMSCSELKGLSPAVTQIIKLTSNATCTAEAIAKAVSQDPAVALKVLKLANSSVYTRGDTVDSVQKAVVRIGLENIRQTVLNVSVIDRFSDVAFDQSLSMQQFWEHSIATGIIAAEIAHTVTYKPADAAFTMGLLHDVGRVVFAEQLRDLYAPVVDAARSLSLPLEQVETRMLSINHADVMDRLLRAWNFPHHLIRPILLHQLSAGGIRSAGSGQSTESLTLALANRLAHAMLLGCSGNDAISPTEELCTELGIGANFINHLEIVASQRTDDMKYAMLAQSSTTAWPRYVEQVRAQFNIPLHPLYVSQQPSLDAHRIFCSVIAEPLSADDTPNIAVMHAPKSADQPALIDKLRAAEKEAGVENLPLILLAQPGQLGVDQALSLERPCRSIATPFVVDRFVTSVNQALKAA